MMTAAMLVMFVFMFMLMIVTTAAMTVMVMMVVMMFLMLIQLSGIQQSLMTVSTHDIINLFAGQLIPGCGDDTGMLITVLPYQLDGFIQTLFAEVLGTAQDDGTSAFQLVVIELTKILDIHPALGGIANGSQAAHFHFTFPQNGLDSSGNIRQLAYTGGLNDDTIRCILAEHITQCLAEITYQGAADAAGIHFCDFNAGILEEAAVNTDLTKFIFNEDDLFALQRAFQQLADEGGFTCTQKAGNNVDFRHINTF